MKITPLVVVSSVVAGLLAAIVIWAWTLMTEFKVPEPWWTSLPMALLYTFADSNLRPVAISSLAKGFAPVFGFLFVLHIFDRNDKATRHLRGARVVSDKDLAQQSKSTTGAVQVKIAGVPVPATCEPSHLLITGGTASGKSVATDEIVHGATSRNDRIISIDPDGHSLARFGRKGDTVLNPFDKRCPGWSIFNEFRRPYDFDLFAKSVIPDTNDATAQQWHGYAQQLFSETARALTQRGETTTEHLRHWLTQAPVSELKSLLAGSAASGQFEKDAERAFASTRFVLSHHLGAFQYLSPGDFSLRNWLESGNGNLFITWREDMLPALRPLVSAWVDILVASILTLPDENPRALWLILDELASLQRLNSLQAGLSKGRKHGLRVVAALQSVSQLDELYGVHNARSLRSNFRNLLALGGSNSDPATAKEISEGLGDAEVERKVTTRTTTKTGSSSSTSKQRTLERAVLPSQLTSLNPLHGYLKFSGDYPIGRIRLIPRNYPILVKTFLERD
jgi:type IV secretory pathway TraG/TraD family ATPase VirD4